MRFGSGIVIELYILRESEDKCARAASGASIYSLGVRHVAAHDAFSAPPPPFDEWQLQRGQVRAPKESLRFLVRRFAGQDRYATA